MRYISTIVRVLKRKIANFIAWRKYKNHTYGHFINDKLIHIGGKETHGVPLIDAYDETCHLYIGKYCSIARGVNILMGGIIIPNGFRLLLSTKNHNYFQTMLL